MKGFQEIGGFFPRFSFHRRIFRPYFSNWPLTVSVRLLHTITLTVGLDPFGSHGCGPDVRSQAHILFLRCHDSHVLLTVRRSIPRLRQDSLLVKPHVRGSSTSYTRCRNTDMPRREAESIVSCQPYNLAINEFIAQQIMGFWIHKQALV